ncbi:Maf-like protein [Paenibacillus sp. J31TS4]|uniref:Maf family protein n=1 Tax=Paenibacillus sp. J31TS4 TaxID=2807195 RepID=UPI001B2D1291|nr:Maf family protein [Paenibacillus sp. J31TS4]GIP39195.1 Maf-like protein [Paenibacillus sp. J31TS4]
MSSQSVPLILASTSPRRRELLGSLGLAFEIRPSHADESFAPGLAPDRIVRELAEKKARAVLESMTETEHGTVVIGSDTIVVLDGEVLGKPADRADAARMLGMLAGRTHEVYTGVACLQAGTGLSRIFFRRTFVKMKPFGDAVIDRYIETGEPGDKAGAYAIQGLGSTLVDSIEGCYFNVVGLPLSLLAEQLADFGIEVI